MIYKYLQIKDHGNSYELVYPHLHKLNTTLITSSYYQRNLAQN